MPNYSSRKLKVSTHWCIEREILLPENMNRSSSVKALRRKGRFPLGGIFHAERNFSLAFQIRPRLHYDATA